MHRTALILVAILGVSPLGRADDPSRAKAVRARLEALQKLKDADLFAKYDTAADYRWTEDKGELTREEVLTEVIRRGGASAEKWLKTKMERDYERRVKEKEKLEPLSAMHEADPKNEALREAYLEQARLVRRLEENLEIFTALRRVQKKPDPLTISVSIPKDAQATTRSLPEVDVKITNTDPERLPIQFMFGGDGRGGRPARWRIEGVDEHGKKLAIEPRRSAIGGGLYRIGPLQGEESFEIKLELRSFVKIPEPGEYTLRVLYHNSVTIADMEDITGLIVCESRLFKLKVVKAPPKVIELKAGERDKAKAAIEALSETAPIRVVVRDYGERDYDFIDPKSPEGQLHMLGWQAVPVMLDFLRDPKTSLHRRAWLVALMFVVIRDEELDPFGMWSDWVNVLPSYEYRRAPGDGSSSGGRINAAEQQKLVERWLAFAKDYIEVKEANK
jgi:hypothetical protein